MARHATIVLLSLGVLALSPGVARADAGTPLMWAEGLHLLFGNAIIGVAEGLILARLFRLKGAGCVGIMIAANYFSAGVGVRFLFPRLSAAASLDLYNAWRWLWCMVAVSYALTLVLEWPFVALCLRQRGGWFAKSLFGTLIVQSASYVVLFGWYWAASGTSLYSDWALVEPSRISLPTGATLFYIAENDGSVCERSLRSAETRRIGEVKSPDNDARLALRQSRGTPGKWDLIIESTRDDRRRSEQVVCAGLAGTAAEPPYAPRPGGYVPKFSRDQSGWSFYFGWMAGALSGNNAKSGRQSYVSLETPFVFWRVDSPTQLPRGQVVFQLGKNQICAVDPDKGTIALVAKGRSPVVMMSNGGE